MRNDKEKRKVEKNIITYKILIRMKKNNKSVTLIGASQREYVFELYTFSDFDEVKGTFKAIPALYMFGKMSEDQSKIKLIYLGETSDLSTRFDNHHKERCIRLHEANCIGICVEKEFKEEEKLKEAEQDILAAYNFPCNDQHN